MKWKRIVWVVEDVEVAFRNAVLAAVRNAFLWWFCGRGKWFVVG
jgi:hypothetical protein